MNRRLSFIAAVFCLTAASAAHAATAIIAPSKDNTLLEQTAVNGQLSSGQGDMFVGRTNQDGLGPATLSIRRGLIAFDIAAAVPVGATITGVTLTVRDVQGLNGDQAVALHRVLEDWGEGASVGGAAKNGDATWLYRFFNEATPAASTPWTTQGGTFSATTSASTVISVAGGAGQLFSWSSAGNPQMLADVQLWLANPASNFGWILTGDESKGQTAKRLNSREATAPGVSPVLVVTYSVPEPTAAALTVLAAAGVLIGTRGCRRLRSY